MAARIGDPLVKRALRHNTEEAVARGVFGVPAVLAGEVLFWGEDAADMLLDWWRDPEAFEDPEMRRVSTLPVGIERR